MKTNLEKTMESFFLITNRPKDPDLEFTYRVVHYLEQFGKNCILREHPSEEPGTWHYTNPREIPKNVDVILVLGGDGTLLQAARDVVGLGIPLFGINLGTLGYLAGVDKENCFESLDALLAGQYEVERRMMLKGSIYRGNHLIARDIALNDIVITREGKPRVVRFDCLVNGTFLNSYQADGIIISTPTGSTGYSLSAGGPIVAPDAAMTLLTPLAPHTLNSRSVVFPAEDRIEVVIGPARSGGQERGIAVFDGDTSISMLTGDRVVIEKSEQDTLILKVNPISFLETLRKKMVN